MPKYHTLIAQGAKGDKWSPQFGDFTKRVVTDEKRDSYTKRHGWYASKVITTDDDSVQTVMQEINLINEKA